VSESGGAILSSGDAPGGGGGSVPSLSSASGQAARSSFWIDFPAILGSDARASVAGKS